MPDCYSSWIQNFRDMEQEEPLRIHNTDSETDAVMVEHEHERQHISDEPEVDEQKEIEDLEGEDLPSEEDEKIPSETEELFRDKKKDPKMYCIWCGKVCTPLLCTSCRKKTIHARIEQRLNSP